MLSKIDRYFEEVICTICLAVVVGSVLLQVILRYFFSTAAAWAEETAVYGMIFAIYLGATMAVRERAHIRITLLVNRLPRALQVGAVVLAAINRWNAGREKALNMLYAVPGIGGALERYQHYHYVNHLGECLAAGFSLPQALKQSARRMPESPIKPRYDKLSRAVDGGESFSSALLKSGILAGVALSVPESGLEPRQVPASLSLALHRACEDQLQFWASILPYTLLGLIPYLVLLNAWFLSR